MSAVTCFAQRGPTVEVYSTTGGGGANGDQSVSLWRLPVDVSVSLGAGYDSNVQTASSNEGGSVFTSGSINLNYNFGTLRTRANLSAGTGIVYYPDLPGDQYDPNLYINLGVTHALSTRATLTLGISVHYQAEPDFSTSLTSDRRAGNYLNTSDSLSLSYEWLQRLSTVTSYSIGAVVFDDRTFSEALDRIEHGFSHSFRFLYLPVTTLVAEYHLGVVTYQNNDQDSYTHSLLVGLDHTFNQKMSGTIRVGAEFRSSDNEFDDHTGFNPHAEASLSYALTGKTSLAWNASYGTQESYIPGAGSDLSFRTGLVASHSFTSRIGSSIAFYYQHNDNAGFEFFPGFDTSFTEDVFDISLNVSYSINRFLSANAGYSHTEVSSELSFRSYSRNHYSGGLSINF